MAGRNQGEGDRESARRYNKAAQKFTRAGKGGAAAGRTRQDAGAESKGRARAKEFDPNVHRNYSKPEK